MVRLRPARLIVAAAVAVTSGLAALASSATAATTATAATATATTATDITASSACNAWTGQHPPYAVEVTGVMALSRCDVWATGIPGQNPTPGSPTDLLHWNGVTWSLITSATVPAALNAVPAITATSASDVWVAGGVGGLEDPVTPDEEQLTLIGHWNGTAFVSVPSPDPGAPLGVSELHGVSAASREDAWAVGVYSVFDQAAETSTAYPLAEHWDGQGWTQVPAAVAQTVDGPTPFSEFFAVDALSGGYAWAVGEYDAPTGHGFELVPLIERWDGSTWTVVPRPNLSGDNELQAVSADSATDAWAVGFHGAPSRTLIEHWNGRAWTVVPSPHPAGMLAGVAAIHPDDAWAAGFYFGPNGRQRSLLLHWDGQSWQQIGVPHFGPGYAPNLLLAVSASSPRNVIVAGFYSGPAGAGQQAIVLHYG